jgi:hypothetical protein
VWDNCNGSNFYVRISQLPPGVLRGEIPPVVPFSSSGDGGGSGGGGVKSVDDLSRRMAGQLYFTFPERPGALKRFLSSMHPNWNISLFHYRHQGADYGRILVGLQVPAGDAAAFDDFLQTLAYPCVEETANPVYRLFLR